MQDQIKKLRDLAEYSLLINNVHAIREKLEEMLVIIEQISSETASDKRECTYLCALPTENTLPEPTRAS